MSDIKEILKEQLDNNVLLYGTLDIRTLTVSQKLDIYMVLEQQKLINNKNTIDKKKALLRKTF